MENPAGSSEDALGSPPAKKRRIPKACASCRTSKVKCDEKRPCTRCYQSGATCVWYARPKDPNEERFDRIEKAIRGINDKISVITGSPSSDLSAVSSATVAPKYCRTAFSGGTRDMSAQSWPEHGQSAPLVQHPPPASIVIAQPRRPQIIALAGTTTGLARFTTRPPSLLDIVASGQISEEQARLWFWTFFHGCDRFVPIFDPAHDTYDSVKGRSSILFDILVIFGCRASEGLLSKAYQSLYHLLKKHTSELILIRTGAPLERIQALLVIASYSEAGAVICDVALRAATEAGLCAHADKLYTSMAVDTLAEDNGGQQTEDHFPPARVWYGLFVLDQILSLDGGKPPSISLRSSSCRVRVLLRHPRRTSSDLRLFAQVELNALRAESVVTIADALPATSSADPNEAFTSTIKCARLDLDLWLSEWQGLVNANATNSDERHLLDLNLRIQHAWAVLALHLRALSASGIENIALMTESQRLVACAAKTAAEHHLQLLLSSTTPSGERTIMDVQSTTMRPYLANFRYAMDFVWAKNVFCVLMVLRLSFLLGDPLPQVVRRLEEAQDFLRELDHNGMGTNISYVRILAQTINKCEKAVKVSLQAESERTSQETSSDNDFQSFIPEEFVFEWNFPGLNLCYIPLDWQDLFLEYGAASCF